MATTLYTPVPRTPGNMLDEIENGKLGLPTLQRDYVFTKRKKETTIINIDLLQSRIKYGFHLYHRNF